MKNSVLLTITSVVSITFLILHVTDDIARGISSVGPSINFIAFPVLAFLLYGALVLGERRSGYIIQLLGAIFAAAMPALHMRGRINEIAQSSGGYFFIFTLITLGALGMFSFALAVRGLWGLRKAEARSV
jgi:hypothetical protein